MLKKKPAPRFASEPTVVCKAQCTTVLTIAIIRNTRRAQYLSGLLPHQAVHLLCTHSTVSVHLGIIVGFGLLQAFIPITQLSVVHLFTLQYRLQLFYFLESKVESRM